MPSASKLFAVMHTCPGVVNDGLFLHSMRDHCTSCAPFWEQLTACPVHGGKLTDKLYCKACRKHYLRPLALDLMQYRNGVSKAEPACDFCNDTQQINGEACGWCVDVAYTGGAK